MRRLLLVLSLAALAAGCSRRDRSNPLDPANPSTGGRPAGFNAIAGLSSVKLMWAPQPGLGIDGFQLQRQRPGDAAFRALGSVLPPTSSSYIDGGVLNGERVRYRLYYVLHGATENLPAEDEATPGALRPWVVEVGGSHLTRLTPDGRDVLFRSSGLGQVQSLAVSPATGAVWCSASYDGRLSWCDPGGNPQLQLTGLHQPFSIALSPQDGSAWVCELSGQVAHIGSDGIARAPGTIAPLDDPQGIAVSPRDFSVWICERLGNHVLHYGPTGTPLGTTTLPQPSRVAMDSLANLTWVASYGTGRLWILNAVGAVLDSTLQVSGPVGIAVDRARGRVWIADAVAGRLLALDPVTLDELFRVSGLPGAWDVSVDPGSGEAWVTVRGLNEVVRVGLDGTILDRCGGLSDPIEVRLDPGGP